MFQLKLDTLPVEIIRLIAASGPYASVAALAGANRALHSACDSWTIYRDLMKIHGNLPYQWLPHSLSRCTNKVTWMNYAGAHSEAVEITGGEAFVPHSAIRSLIHWMPQLVIAQHPALFSSRFYNGLPHSAANRGWRSNLHDEAALAFCCAAVAMSGNARSTVEASRHVYETSPFIWGPYDIVHETTRDQDLVHSDSEESRVKFMIALASLLQVLTVLAPDFHDYHQSLHPEVRDFKTRAASLMLFVRPPSREDIPLYDHIGDLAMPFTTTTADLMRSIYEQYLEIMTKPAFIEDGEWIGYLRGYTMSVVDQYNNVTAQEHPDGFLGIAIKIQTETKDRDLEDSDEVIPPEHDEMAFDLSCVAGQTILGLPRARFENGSLSRLTGSFALNSLSPWVPGVHPLHYEGMMTPFGIIATAGRGKWLWLWKRAWSGPEDNFVDSD